MNDKKHTGKDDNSMMLLAIGASTVLSFLVIFIVVSFSVSKSEMKTAVSPANWESAHDVGFVADSAQVADIDTLNDTLFAEIIEPDTLSLEEIVKEIAVLRAEIVKKHIALLKAGDVKKDIAAKYNQLSRVKKELYDLKNAHEKLAAYKNNLPKEIISSVSNRLSERQ